MSLEKRIKLNPGGDCVHLPQCYSDVANNVIELVEITECTYFSKPTTSTRDASEDPEKLIKMNEVSVANRFLEVEHTLATNVAALSFSNPVLYIYNPIKYAYDVHSKYVYKFCNSTKKVMFLGMNPGPWGMSQTGVPFGEVNMVRDWMGITGYVGRPDKENPARPVTGFDCKRSEISGKRFWGLFRDLCVDPCNFFHNTVVYNYCPVAFMTESGKNITPSELKVSERKAINHLCDEALCNVLQLFQVSIIVAIGKFAEKRATTAVKASGMSNIKIEYILHPSPRNFGVGDWKDVVTQRLREMDLMQYFSEKKWYASVTSQYSQ